MSGKKGIPLLMTAATVAAVAAGAYVIVNDFSEERRKKRKQKKNRFLKVNITDPNEITSDDNDKNKIYSKLITLLTNDIISIISLPSVPNQSSFNTLLLNYNSLNLTSSSPSSSPTITSSINDLKKYYNLAWNLNIPSKEHGSVWIDVVFIKSIILLHISHFFSQLFS